MSGSIQEGHIPVSHLDAVGADMLGDAAGLSLRDVGMTDGVQNRGLAMIDVAHNHHNRRTGHQVFLVVLAVVDNLFLDGDHHFLFHLCVEFVGDQHRGVKINHVVDGGEHAQTHQLFDDLGGGNLQAQGKISHSDLFGNLDGDVLGLALLGDTVQPFSLGFPLAAALVPSSLLIAVGEFLLSHHIVRLHLLVGQTVVFFIVPVDIHVGRPGVDDAPDRLAHPGDHHGLLAPLGRVLRLCRLLLLGGSLLPLLRPVLILSGAVAPFLSAGLGGFLLLRRLCRGGRGRGRLYCRHGGTAAFCKIGVQIVHAPLLGKSFEHHVQLIFLQSSHIFLGLREIFGQGIKHILVGNIQILRHFTNSVFYHHKTHSSFSRLPSSTIESTALANPLSVRACTPAFLPQARLVSSMSAGILTTGIPAFSAS